MNQVQAVATLTDNRAAIAAQALKNATENNSVANYQAIFDGFAEKGIPAEEIEPRINVLTYNAWLAVGRQVRRGETGVRVVTMVRAKSKAGEAGEGGEGEGASFKFARTVSVFHITQTDAIEPKA